MPGSLRAKSWLATSEVAHSASIAAGHPPDVNGTVGTTAIHLPSRSL